MTVYATIPKILAVIILSYSFYFGTVMSIELPPYRPIKKRSGLAVMGAAFHALLMRELQTRFGSYRLGYLWAPLEVILQMAIMMIIFAWHGLYAVFGGRVCAVFYDAKNRHSLTRSGLC